MNLLLQYAIHVYIKYQTVTKIIKIVYKIHDKVCNSVKIMKKDSKTSRKIPYAGTPTKCLSNHYSHAEIQDLCQ